MIDRNRTRRIALAASAVAIAASLGVATAGQPVFRSTGTQADPAPSGTGTGTGTGGDAGSTQTAYKPTPASSPSADYVAATNPLILTATSAFTSQVATGSQAQEIINASGGLQPYTFSRTSTLPGESAGPTPYGSSYEISGDFPAGDYPATGVTVTDSSGQTATIQTAPFTVANPVGGTPSPITITANSSFPSFVPSGSRIEALLAISGGTPPLTITENGLASGVTASHLDGNTADDLAGSPADGSYGAATVSVVDAAGTTASYSTTPFTVGPADASRIVLKASSDFPSRITSGQHAYGGYDIKGGDGNYSYAITHGPGVKPDDAYTEDLEPARHGFGNFPANLSFGVTAYVGDVIGPYVITVTDGSGRSGSFTTTATSVDSGGGSPGTVGLALQAEPDLPQRILPGTYVQADYAITGGTAPYSVAFDDPLAAGLSGQITQGYDGTYVALQGVPTTTGANPSDGFTVTDAAGLTVRGTTGAFTLEPPPPPQVTTAVPFAADYALGDGVAATFAVSGGQGPYAITTGALDEGLTAAIGPADVLISGTPGSLGVHAPMEIDVVDAAGARATFTTASFRVDDPATTPPGYDGGTTQDAQNPPTNTPNDVTPYPKGYRGVDGSETGTGYAATKQFTCGASVASSDTSSCNDSNSTSDRSDDPDWGPNETKPGEATVDVHFRGIITLNQVPGPLDQQTIHTYTLYGHQYTLLDNYGPALTGGKQPYSDIKVELDFDPQGYVFAIQPDGWGFIVSPTVAYTGPAGNCRVSGKDATGAVFHAYGECYNSYP